MISMCFGEKLILWVSKENLSKDKAILSFLGLKKTKLEDKGRRWIIRKIKTFHFS